MKNQCYLELVHDFLVQTFKAERQELVAPLHYPVRELFESKDKLLLKVGRDKAAVRNDLHDYVLLIDRGDLFLRGMIDLFDCVPVKHHGPTSPACNYRSPAKPVS